MIGSTHCTWFIACAACGVLPRRARFTEERCHQGPPLLCLHTCALHVRTQTSCTDLVVVQCTCPLPAAATSRCASLKSKLSVFYSFRPPRKWKLSNSHGDARNVVRQGFSRPEATCRSTWLVLPRRCWACLQRPHSSSTPSRQSHPMLPDRKAQALQLVHKIDNRTIARGDVPPMHQTIPRCRRQ